LAVHESAPIVLAVRSDIRYASAPPVSPIPWSRSRGLGGAELLSWFQMTKGDATGEERLSVLNEPGIGMLGLARVETKAYSLVK
jgi:hypothetical protein